MKTFLLFLFFFSRELETEAMAYAEELDYTCTGVFHTIGYVFKIRIILCKLKLGSQGGNILNNTNLFLKEQDRTLCNVFL